MGTDALLKLVFALGCVCGLRSMTAPALVCWGARVGWLNLGGSRLAFLGTLPAVILFTLLAMGELVADKLPNIPGRNTPGPLAARFVLGGICGVALCISAHASSGIYGFLTGGMGGVVGGVAGYYIRRYVKRRFRLPDFPVAVTEDVLALAGGLLIVSRF
ncbi:MAG TPA: DUF4126 family protein [Acidisarcina sp.]|nr:DUF4126 family protein [Acidisarcina sp.]